MKISSILLSGLLPLGGSVAQAQFTYTTNNGWIAISGYTGSGGAVTIPSTINGWPVSTVGDSTFWKCTSLTSLTIPDSVTYIGPWAFNGCANLTNIVIGRGVIVIGAVAFNQCLKLEKVYFAGDAPAPESDSFDGEAGVPLYYIAGTTGWSDNFVGLPTVPINAVAVTANPAEGVVPLTVSFTSANVDSGGNAIIGRNWVFSDGSTSVAQNPSHSYSTAGSFYPVLFATNSAGATVLGVGGDVTVSLPSVAFSANPVSGAAPLTVQFESANADGQGNYLTNWYWAFGDGSTSTARNPSHTYAGVWTFHPYLVATNEQGGAAMSDTLTSIEVTSGLVSNGGFETGDFTGWTLATPDSNIVYIDTVENGVTNSTFSTDGRSWVHSGIYGAGFGERLQLATLSQSLSTVPNQTYLLSFWLESPPNPYELTNIFMVNWNTNTSSTNTVYAMTNVPAFGWSNFTFSVTAASTNTVLQFAARIDYDWFGFDDVSIAPPQLVIGSLGLYGANLVLNGLNGIAGASYYVLTSTNLNLPLGQWTRVATNIPSANGNFTLTVTNAVTSAPQQRFYVLQTQ